MFDPRLLHYVVQDFNLWPNLHMILAVGGRLNKLAKEKWTFPYNEAQIFVLELMIYSYTKVASPWQNQRKDQSDQCVLSTWKLGTFGPFVSRQQRLFYCWICHASANKGR